MWRTLIYLQADTRQLNTNSLDRSDHIMSDINVGFIGGAEDAVAHITNNTIKRMVT